LVETIEDLLASPSSCSLENLEVYWDTMSRLHFPRKSSCGFLLVSQVSFGFKPVKI
jgi:hypothetical protein